MATDRPTPTGPAAPELSIVESRVYRGGNVWSYTPAIHLVVDLGVLEGYPTDTLEGFTDRLVGLLPGLEGHTCSRGVKGGFVARLNEGTWLGHVTEHVALQLQQEAGHDVRRGKTRAVKGVPGRYNVIYGYADESVGLAAGTLAVRLVNHLVQAEEGFDFQEELDLFLRRAQRTAFGPSTAAILEEAVSRDIPYIRLNTASLVQLGQGVHAQRIRATMTSKTGALAVDLAGDKDMTTRLLASAGLPVPKQETVRTRMPPPSRPAASVTPSSSSRSTATTGAACASTCRTRRRCEPASPRPRASRAAATSSSSPSSRVATTGASSSAARCRRSPSAFPPTWSVTPRTRSRSSSRSPTPTRAAVSATRRC